MPLAAGDKLGPYEILRLIGAGGMGEVYLARDPRLGRDVAIKISAAQFTERFEREARAVAALNHPNICTLHDVGPNYLVMEFVEGESPKGPLPLEEALRIARQIAAALEEAHEKGITHRDLKPANIKIKPDGTVKVLDFGLAKVDAPTATPTENSPTLSMAATQAGVILGTAGYMSPEQARGKPVDKRADIWAFGVVLYEIVTGKRLFQGEDITETLASVVKEQPDLSEVPAQMRRLLQACLEKDPRKRLQAIGDMRLLLEAAPESRATGPRHWLGRVGWLVAGAAVSFAATLAFIHFRETAAAPQVLQYTIDPPEKTRIADFALSPDGRYLAMTATGERGTQLWVRALDSMQAQLLTGTEGADYPFWSPDSRYVGFFAGDKLKKIAATGGPAQTLCDAPLARGGTWNRENVIVFSSGSGIDNAGLHRVSAAGGVAVQVTKVNGGGVQRFPVFLPDGRRFLYLESVGKENGVYLGSLDTKPESQKRQRVIADDANPRYVPPAEGNPHGHVLFVREGTLMAQPLDPKSLEPAGDVFPVAEHVSRGLLNAYFFYSISDPGSGHGMLVYRSGGLGNLRQHAWFDRSGKQLAAIGGPVPTQGRLALSPEEKRLITERVSGNVTDLWMTEVDRGTESRFTFDASANFAPVWSPDGSKVAFASSRGAAGRGSGVSQVNLYQRAASGAGQDELLLQSDTAKIPTDWTRDGRFIIFRQNALAQRMHLFALPVTGDKKPIPLMTSEFNEVMGQVSPDGRWLAYASDESGHYEVYAVPFAPGASKPISGKWQISLGDGRDPHWRGDSRELFYVTSTRKMMAVEIRATGDSLGRGTPQVMFVRQGRHLKTEYSPPETVLPSTARADFRSRGRKWL
jgi:Tol biopolymer transport system component